MNEISAYTELFDVPESTLDANGGNPIQQVPEPWWWLMAPEMIFMVDGNVLTTEKYSEIWGEVTLDPRLFDPQFGPRCTARSDNDSEFIWRSRNCGNAGHFDRVFLFHCLQGQKEAYRIA